MDEMLNWIDEQFIKSYLRILVLFNVGRGHTHGYDMIKAMEKHADQHGHDLNISPSSLYPTLSWLEKKGYLSSHWEHDEKGPGRKVYQLTEKGSKVVDAAKKRLSLLLKQYLHKGEED